MLIAGDDEAAKRKVAELAQAGGLRARELWEGHVAARMTTLPLDVDDLLGEPDGPVSEPFSGLPPQTTMGHVHLKVADIPQTLEFYCDALGFALMAQLGPYAAFLSAGGYHHHVGANTWESAGATPPRRAARHCATRRSRCQTKPRVIALSRAAAARCSDLDELVGDEKRVERTAGGRGSSDPP